MKIIIMIYPILLIVMNCAYGLEFLAHSAKRELSLDYRQYAQAYSIYEMATKSGTALSSAKPFNPNALYKAVAWKKEHLLPRFHQLRDSRLFSKMVNYPPRRISWLYPDDGCFARASMANRSFYQWKHQVPSKVFAFGNLRVKTKNSPRGVVGWWYHVAPAISVEGVVHALDPSIEPARPLKLIEWLKRMGTPEKIKIAVCSTGTNFPKESCTKVTDGVERNGERLQMQYLRLEEQRIKRLGRSPRQELGTSPPWSRAFLEMTK